MNFRHVLTAMSGICLTLATSPVAAQTMLASNSLVGTTPSARYYGQSFAVLGSGSFDHVTFSFRDGANANVASGMLYIFGSECSACTPSNLASQAGGTASMAASGNVFTFNPTFALTGGQTYYAYSDTIMSVAYSGATDSYAGGAAYTRPATAGGATSAYGIPQSGDTAFIVQSAVAASPEPGSWLLMILGFGMVGYALRRRRVGFTPLSATLPAS